MCLIFLSEIYIYVLSIHTSEEKVFQFSKLNLKSLYQIYSEKQFFFFACYHRKGKQFLVFYILFCFFLFGFIYLILYNKKCCNLFFEVVSYFIICLFLKICCFYSFEQFFRNRKKFKFFKTLI